MKNSLSADLATTRSIEVDKPRTIDFMGEELRVYATPELVRDIEVTCREMLLEHLDDEEDSVGTRVEIDHTGATLLGMNVTISATISAVEGRAVSFEVTASDDLEQVATAKHSRFIVHKGKLGERLKAKADKANG